jgi:amidohydrolase
VESEILQEAIEIKEYLTKTRRHIHQHPELGFKEFEATSLVKRELESMGVEVVPIGVAVLTQFVLIKNQ